MDNLIGKKIVGIREMTKRETENEGWEFGATTIVLNDGTMIYPSIDEEGNRAGILFGIEKGGRKIWIDPISKKKLKKVI